MQTIQHIVQLTILGNISPKHIAVISKVCSTIDQPQNYSPRGLYKLIKMLSLKSGLFMPDKCPKGLIFTLEEGADNE